MNSILDYVTFLQRRVGRLFPLHWLTLLASIAIWSMFVLLHFYATHTPSFKPECIAETAFLLHSFLSCGNGIPFNGVSWSISAEMVMYIAFPVIAIIGARSAPLLFGIGVTSLTVMMTVVVSQHEWKLLGSSWIQLSPVLRAMPSFVLGAALFYNRKIVSQLPAPGFILAVASVTLVVAMLSGVSELMTLLIIYTVAIAAIAADLEGVPSALVRRIAPLGQLTYSIYMWHSLLILVLMNAIGDKFLHGNTFATVILAIACYSSIFITSYLSFFFIETPARRWIDGITLSKVSGLFRSLPFLVGAARDTPRTTDHR